MNLSDLRDRVRTLTGVYATDMVSDALLNAWLNEAYTEIDRAQDWTQSPEPWYYSALNDDSDSPAFHSQFHPILAYRVAIKVLGVSADDTQRSQLYAQEYEALTHGMLDYYFIRVSHGNHDTVMDLVQYVRNLTGFFDGSLNNQLVQSWLNEAYTELSLMRSWEWLQDTASFAVVDGSSSFSLTDGARRVLEVWFTGSAGGKTHQINRAPYLDDVDPNTSIHSYTVSSTGDITVAPAFGEAGTLHVRYEKSLSDIDAETEAPFYMQLRMMLAYRAAHKACAIRADKRAEAFGAEYQSLVSQMMAAYSLDHDTRPFSMGSSGMDSRKYIPWFRAS